MTMLSYVIQPGIQSGRVIDFGSVALLMSVFLSNLDQTIQAAGKSEARE